MTGGTTAGDKAIEVDFTDEMSGVHKQSAALSSDDRVAIVDVNFHGSTLFTREVTESPTDWWDYGVYALNTSALLVEGCMFWGAYGENNYDTLPTAFVYAFNDESAAGIARNPVNPRVEGCTAHYVTRAVHIKEHEGVKVHRFEFVQVGIGIHMENAASQPGMEIMNGHINAFECGVWNESQTSGQMGNVLIYAHPSGNPAVDFIGIENKASNVQMDQVQVIGQLGYASLVGVLMSGGADVSLTNALFDSVTTGVKHIHAGDSYVSNIRGKAVTNLMETTSTGDLLTQKEYFFKNTSQKTADTGEDILIGASPDFMTVPMPYVGMRLEFRANVRLTKTTAGTARVHLEEVTSQGSWVAYVDQIEPGFQATLADGEVYWGSIAAPLTVDAVDDTDETAVAVAHDAVESTGFPAASYRSIYKVVVTVTEAFNDPETADNKISVGVDGDEDVVMAGVDVGTVGTYTYLIGYRNTTTNTVKAFYQGTATTGEATVAISWRKDLGFRLTGVCSAGSYTVAIGDAQAHFRVIE